MTKLFTGPFSYNQQERERVREEKNKTRKNLMLVRRKENCNVTLTERALFYFQVGVVS